MSENRFALDALETRTFLSVGSVPAVTGDRHGTLMAIHVGIAATPSAAPSVLSQHFKLSGHYSLGHGVPDVGATYAFTGAGKSASLGPVDMTGSIQLPGFIATGQATGQLTLSSARGTLTLTVSGSSQKGFGTMPRALTYSISGGTGAYSTATGTGQITVTLSARRQAFTFSFHHAA